MKVHVYRASNHRRKKADRLDYSVEMATLDELAILMKEHNEDIVLSFPFKNKEGVELEIMLYDDYIE